MKKPVILATTVVLLREQKSELQILLLRRNPKLSFAANNWVFPGGKIEPFELKSCINDLILASKKAAIRECQEETQIDISRNEITPISHWTTPDFRPKRFATQFFITLLDETVANKVVIDQSEIVEHQWLSANDALKKHSNNELEIMPPTYVTLSELSNFQQYEDAIKYYTERKTRTYNPRMKIHELDEHVDASFLYEGDSGYDLTDPQVRNQLNRCEMKNGVIKHICNLD